MKQISLLPALLAFLAMGCSGVVSPSEGRSGVDLFSAGYLYGRADGRQPIGCQLNDGKYFGCGSSPEIDLNSGLYDCSDDAFLCVTNGKDLMAVPKAGMQAKATYSFEGHLITVTRCSSETVCQDAVLTSTCESDNCGCGYLPVADRRITYVYYSAKGITAFSAVVGLQGADADQVAEETLLSSYVLVRDKGFLTDNVQLSPMPTCGGQQN